MSSTSSGWWSKLNPQHKQYVLFGCVAILLILASLFMTSGNKTSISTQSKAPVIDNILGSKVDGEELGLSRVSTDLSSAEQRMQLQDQNIAALQKELDELRNRPADSQGPTQEQLQTLRDNLQTAQGQNGGVVGPPPPPPRLVFKTFEETVVPETTTTGNTVSSGTNQSPDGSGDAEKDSVYIPAGSLITGVLVTGLDAPTGRGASSQPIPVLIRVKQEGLLPSRRRIDVREAFILASGFGDIASERTYLRSERLSMVLANGSVIDVPVEMSAVGSDGRAGLRAKLVSKQGKAMRRAALAGLADGVSRTLQANYANDQSAQNGNSNAGAVVLAGAGSSSLDKISQFYLNLADQMYPILETPAGREVTFILLKGVSLPLNANAKPPR